MAQIWAAGIAAALALLVAAVCFLTQGGERPGFEKGELLVCVNGGGDVELYWPGTTDPTALYQVEFTCGEARETRYCSQPSLHFSGLPEGAELKVQVRAVADGKTLFGTPRQLNSWKTFKASLVLQEGLEAPEVTGVLKEGTVFLTWTGGGERYEIFRTYEMLTSGAANRVPVASTRDRAWSVSWKEEERASLRSFAVRASWQKRGFILCGPASIPMEESNQNLPSGGELSLTYQETGSRLYALEWNGIQCHHFEVQRWAGEDWQTLTRIAPEAHMRYETGRLDSGSYNRFRVVARPAGDLDSDLGTEEAAFWASVSPLYGTVWPIQNLTLFENPEKGDRLASLPGGTALCVLAEEGDWFRVRYGEEYGWVDSRFCMINLPEYVGDHCSYDITNSYDSLFAVHGSPIREVTHQVLPGYENIQTAEGTFLVPYLYPCAKKLLTAAQAAEADGLRLKIYEAFRPQEATRFSYDTTEKQLNNPARTETGEQMGVTVFKLMTDGGRFHLGSFLARTISSHNRGIALDLTLEKLNGGGELEMQSAIHDLSWYSETYLNNLNAKLLEGYMTGVGMQGLSSEWWHFQDDGTRAAIGLNACLDKGVSAEGWTQDDSGWRYRTAEGSFVRDNSRTIDGKRYTFDGDGYCQQT